MYWSDHDRYCLLRSQIGPKPALPVEIRCDSPRKSAAHFPLIVPLKPFFSSPRFPSLWAPPEAQTRQISPLICTAPGPCCRHGSLCGTTGLNNYKRDERRSGRHTLWPALWPTVWKRKTTKNQPQTKQPGIAGLLQEDGSRRLRPRCRPRSNHQCAG